MSDEGLEWMPWFWRRFWNSGRVARMSDSAVLLYQWLLSQQFEEGYLEPADVLRRVVPARFASRWPKLWAEVAPCFEVLEDGRLQNAVCAEHRLNALGLIEKRRAAAVVAGRASGASRRAAKSGTKVERPFNDRSTPEATSDQRAPNKEQDSREQKAPSVLPPNPPPAATAEPPRSRRSRVPAADAASVTIPDSLRGDPDFEREWAAWLADRRARGKPVTAGAARRQLAKCEGLGADRARTAIAASIENGWTGIFEPKSSPGPTALRPETSTRAWLEAQSREQPRTVDVEGRRTA